MYIIYDFTVSLRNIYIKRVLKPNTEFLDLIQNILYILYIIYK